MSKIDIAAELRALGDAIDEWCDSPEGRAQNERVIARLLQEIRPMTATTARVIERRFFAARGMRSSDLAGEGTPPRPIAAHEGLSADDLIRLYGRDLGPDGRAFLDRAAHGEVWVSPLSYEYGTDAGYPRFAVQCLIVGH